MLPSCLFVAKHFPTAICALSPSSDPSYLAYPSPVPAHSWVSQNPATPMPASPQSQSGDVICFSMCMLTLPNIIHTHKAPISFLALNAMGTLPHAPRDGLREGHGDPSLVCPRHGEALPDLLQHAQGVDLLHHFQRCVHIARHEFCTRHGPHIQAERAGEGWMGVGKAGAGALWACWTAGRGHREC